MPAAKPKPVKAAKLSAVAAHVDELGELELWAAPLGPKLARIDELRKSVRDHFASSPSLPHQVDGARFTAFIGIQGPPVPVAFTRAGSRSLKVFSKTAS
jgi:hypothetical protein